MNGHSISLRLATLKDADLLLEWRNDKTTRMACHKDGKIDIAEHLQWLRKVLACKNRELYVAEDKGISVGSMRADYDNGVYELSWTVSPKYRGKGIGKLMVRLLADEITKPIRAEVKKGNEASKRIAEYSNMKFRKKDSNGVLHYQREELSS